MNRFPTIHNNGTSREELTQHWTAVLKAAETLRVALADAFPNGRDYYPQRDEEGQNPWWDAAKQHRAMEDANKLVIQRATAVLLHLKREAA